MLANIWLKIWVTMRMLFTSRLTVSEKAELWRLTGIMLLQQITIARSGWPEIPEMQQ
jgi:hypothetical protein